MEYFVNVLIGLDQLANTLLKGWPDETLSARSWRCRNQPGWGAAKTVIDGLFFFQPGHCEKSFTSELLRSQCPPAERVGKPNEHQPSESTPLPGPQNGNLSD